MLLPPINQNPYHDKPTIFRYDQKDSTTFQALGNSASVNLIGGASTSGPLIKEHCSLHTKNGSSWDYPNQTSACIRPSNIPEIIAGFNSRIFPQ